MSCKQEQKRLRDRVHAWLKRKYPRTGVCQNPDCSGKPYSRTEYANLWGHKYTKNVDDFMEMCPSCHKNYDMNDEVRKNISLGHKGISVFLKCIPIIAYKNGEFKFFKSTREAEKILNILNTSIVNCLKGRSKTAGGFYWRYQNVK